MELVREVVETFVRLVKSEIHPGAVLVCADDIFEVTAVPSVVLQGPTLTTSSHMPRCRILILTRSCHSQLDPRRIQLICHEDPGQL